MMRYFSILHSSCCPSRLWWMNMSLCIGRLGSSWCPWTGSLCRVSRTSRPWTSSARPSATKPQTPWCLCLKCPRATGAQSRSRKMPLCDGCREPLAAWLGVWWKTGNDALLSHRQHGRCQRETCLTWAFVLVFNWNTTQDRQVETLSNPQLPLNGGHCWAIWGTAHIRWLRGTPLYVRYADVKSASPCTKLIPPWSGVDLGDSKPIRLMASPAWAKKKSKKKQHIMDNRRAYKGIHHVYCTTVIWKCHGFSV